MTKYVINRLSTGTSLKPQFIIVGILFLGNFVIEISSGGTDYFVSTSAQGLHDFSSWSNACKFAAIAYGGNHPSEVYADGNTFYVDGGLRDMTYNSPVFSYGNLHLAAEDTVARNYGVNFSALLITLLNADKDGLPCPQGSSWDIGVYEYGEGRDTTPPERPTGRG